MRSIHLVTGGKDNLRHSSPARPAAGFAEAAAPLVPADASAAVQDAA